MFKWTAENAAREACRILFNHLSQDGIHIVETPVNGGDEWKPYVTVIKPASPNFDDLACDQLLPWAQEIRSKVISQGVVFGHPDSGETVTYRGVVIAARIDDDALTLTLVAAQML